jgi:hypothetical protein
LPRLVFSYSKRSWEHIDLTSLVVFLLAAAIVLFLKHRSNRVLSGLPTGKLVAADDEGQECPVLISNRDGLRSRPDALVRMKTGAIIPIERKRSSALRRGPYDSDLIQAIAYGMLGEDNYSQAPPYVRIQYADRWFDEPFTDGKSSDSVVIQKGRFP